MALSPKHRGLLDGIGSANSVTVDFHKLFYQPIGGSALLIRHARNQDLELASEPMLASVAFQYAGLGAIQLSELDRLNASVRKSLMLKGHPNIGMTKIDGRVHVESR